MYYIIIFLSLFFSKGIVNAENPLKSPSNYVSVNLSGQLGNQLFQIATAYAYSLDHNLTLTIPDLRNKNIDNIPYNAKKLFLPRIACYEVRPPKLQWTEPSFNYHEIPFSMSINLSGYFQSEKYFKHRRKEILELFAAPPELEEQILNKYPFLLSNKLVVGIQIRDYRPEQPSGNYHPTKDRAYYKEAMSYFPEETIFLVSSNNPHLAKECTEGLSPNIIYLQGADYIEEFYTLVLCKSFIISNSSFGWWASWLSTSENKIVIAPNQWFSPPYNNDVMKKDIHPNDCIILGY